MIETYSRNAADLIRYDFVKFDRPSPARVTPVKSDNVTESQLRESLEQLRSEMANDDGRSSFGTYKCPIF